METIWIIPQGLLSEAEYQLLDVSGSTIKKRASCTPIFKEESGTGISCKKGTRKIFLNNKSDSTLRNHHPDFPRGRERSYSRAFRPVVEAQMIPDPAHLEIYVRPGKTDMRKQINGLSAIVQEEMELDLFSPSLFLFCNRERRILKAIYWDKNGFCQWLKKLEKDRFPWPKDEREAVQISYDQLTLLLKALISGRLIKH